MSNKIKTKLKEPGNTSTPIVTRTHTLRDQDFNFLRSLDQIRYTVDQYLHKAEGEFLKMVSVDLGYKPEEDLEFSIDLKENTKELTVSTVPKKKD
jgi:hypothetical protein